MTINKNIQEKTQPPIDSETNDHIFILDKIYPTPENLFRSYSLPSISDSDALIVLDTNSLLLPYTVRKDNLSDLRKVYTKLSEQERLFLPARVAREFIKNRDRKLADILQAINDMRSRIFIGEAKISPVLEGLVGSNELDTASKSLSDAKASFSKALDKILMQIQSWRGDDPVTDLYRGLFRRDNIIELDDNRDELKYEWDRRRSYNIPPGYKDNNKEDTGIGDFLIWKSLLLLGKNKKKDVIFVTGEEKSDWFVRAGNAAIYPRPELIFEYSEVSGGRNLRLASLHELLRDMSAPTDVIEEFESAERSANNAISLARLTTASARATSTGKMRYSNLESTKHHAQSLPYGGGEICLTEEGQNFTFEVSEASPNSLWLYKKGNATQITTFLFDLPTNSPINFTAFDNDTVINVRCNDIFCVANDTGGVLVARLVSTNIPRQHEKMNIQFMYRIFQENEGLYSP